MANRLGVIVPFRNRYEHLLTFRQEIERHLINAGIDYRIIIVEQDDAKLFNRGMLLNIGFRYAKKMKCNYVVFHDIDMIPIEVDYSYSDIPLHLAEKTFDEYFGGVTLFPIKDFEKINGYSNKYWGWGFEDDDLLLRCKKKNIKLDLLRIYGTPISKTSLKLNGVDSYIRGKNIMNFNKDVTISVSFYPDDIICNHKKDTDRFSVFSIPGYDMSISYDSFKRYSLVLFDSNKKVLFANSEIKTNYKTTITTSFDIINKKIMIYQDATLIGVIDGFDAIYDYNKEPHFYLGMGSPHRVGSENYFKGYIDSFIVFDKFLNLEDVKKLIDTDYKDINDCILHYNANEIESYKLKDLSGKSNSGKIFNCEIVNIKVPAYKLIKVPYRRNSKFMLLNHSNNGFFNNKWKHQETRWNQLRFINEVSTNSKLLENDGLSTLEFIEYGKIRTNNILHIKVGI